MNTRLRALKRRYGHAKRAVLRAFGQERGLSTDSIAGSDAHRLLQMRALGVVWNQGEMPQNTESMTAADEAKAMRLFEGMSDKFVGRMLKGKGG